MCERHGVTKPDTGWVKGPCILCLIHKLGKDERNSYLLQVKKIRGHVYLNIRQILLLYSDINEKNEKVTKKMRKLKIPTTRVNAFITEFILKPCVLQKRKVRLTG